MKEIKDFCKWLGVNEKVAKVVVWLFLIMISLIIVNASLDSLGFPYYKITADNLSHIDSTRLIGNICNTIMGLFSFYSIVLLVLRISNYKVIFKHSIIFIILNLFINKLFGYAITQVFIFAYIISFIYFNSNKKLIYIVYGIISFIVNSVIQYICYIYKLQFLDYSIMTGYQRLLLSIDYFLIMLIIILIKEIIIKKRGEKKWVTAEQHAGYGSENSTKKNHLQKKSQQN